MSETGVINTPDQRLRVFVSSTLQELGGDTAGWGNLSIAQSTPIAGGQVAQSSEPARG